MAKFGWRFIETADYGILQSWWDAWGWPQSPSLDMLPSNGVFVYDNETGTLLYGGFLYMTGTSLGWVEYVVSNKDAEVSMRRGALEYLMEVIGILAKSKGVYSLFTSTCNPSFVQSLKKCGFQIGDTNMVNLIKSL